MNAQQQWYSNGKLLISGEYLVMEGAKSFALPLNQGQNLRVKTSGVPGQLSWTAKCQNKKWFHAVLDMNSLKVLSTDNEQLASNLSRILLAVRSLSASFLRDGIGYEVETNLDFNTAFGFGSSSTLISNLAGWANVNPYTLLGLTFGGSGYDIACARTDSPIIYQRSGTDPIVEKVNFNPNFKENIFFVYLGKKQKSTESITSFKQSAVFNQDDIAAISNISKQIIDTNSLQEFENLLIEHEKRMSVILGRPTIKSQFFSKYEGVVKSLGGWGGDFVLLTTDKEEDDFRSSMKKLGFPVVYAYDELVL